MIRLFKYIVFIVLFLESLVVFIPKTNLYYYILNKLQVRHINTTQGSLKDEFFSFSIFDLKIFYDNLNIINIKSINTKTYILLSKVELSDLKIDSSLKKFLPSKIRYIIISHNIADPLKVKIKADLFQATAHGVYDIKTNKVTMIIKGSKQFVKLYGKLLSQAKKLKTGEYQIEYKL